MKYYLLGLFLYLFLIPNAEAITEIETECGLFDCYTILDLSSPVLSKDIGKRFQVDFNERKLKKSNIDLELSFKTDLRKFKEMDIEFLTSTRIKVSGSIEGASKNQWGMRYKSDLSFMNSTWWNSTWEYRNEVNVTENYGENFTYYPITYTLTHQGNASSNCADVRIVENTTLLPYGITDYTSSTCDITVQINLTANQTHTHYAYYGNPSASAVNVSYESVYWNFIDDFNDASFDTTNWGKFTNKPGNCFITEEGLGYVTASQDTSNTYCGISYFQPDYPIKHAYSESESYLSSGGGGANKQLQYGFRMNAQYNMFTIMKANDFQSRVDMYGTNMTGTQIYAYNPPTDTWFHWKVWAFDSNRTFQIWTLGDMVLRAQLSNTSGNSYENAPNYTIQVENDAGMSIRVGDFKIRHYIEPSPTVNLGTQERNFTPPTTTTTTLLRDLDVDIVIDPNTITSFWCLDNNTLYGEKRHRVSLGSNQSDVVTESYEDCPFGCDNQTQSCKVSGWNTYKNYLGWGFIIIIGLLLAMRLSR
jgi:hypothetical protein